MIVKPSGTTSNAFFVIPEDADDLLTLRRIIEKNDRIFADTTRLIKQIREYGRPDKGERVKVRIAIRVENSELDAAVDRLRIAGIITDTDNELVTKGTHHSLSVHAGDMITIDKGRRWQDIEVRLLNSARSDSFILVAVDSQEAAVARVSGTHVRVLPNIYSGQSGKRYQTKNNPNMEIYFTDIAKALSSIIGENDKVIIFGPGETRRRLFNSFAGRQEIPKERLQVIEGVDVAGEDGIFVFLRSPVMKQVMSSSKLASVSSMLERVMLMVNKSESKFAMGMRDVSQAASMKAIESVMFSDFIFKSVDEEQVVKLLNSIESYGAKTFAVDSSTDIGLRVSSLGGIVAILRYSIR